MTISLHARVVRGGGMSGIAVVFPGQGSQRPGMARDFHDRYPLARDTFAEASEALGFDVPRLCFDDDPRLDLTEYTQPAILTAEMAMYRALYGALGLRPAWFGGHSLGEYVALCAAGALPFADALRVVRLRGALMQSAVPPGAGAMAAIMNEGIATRDLTEIIGEDVDLANRNSRNQVVLAGTTGDVDRACERLRESVPGVEIARLAVSAPFHSRHMRSVERGLRAALEDLAPRAAADRARAVTSNFLGDFHTGDMADLVNALAMQASHPVEWIANMRALGPADRIIEIGPSRPLRGFFDTIGREVESIVSVKSAEKVLAS